MNTLEKRRARDGQHPNEEVGEERCFQRCCPHVALPHRPPKPSPTHILSRFFLCGASISNQQAEGTFFGSSVGMGSASVGEGQTPEQTKDRWEKGCWALAPHERLPEILVVPREKTPTGAAARGNP